MFVLFFNLYMAMLSGVWRNYTIGEISATLRPIVNGLGTFLTSMFNNVDTPMETLGDTLFGSNSLSTYNYFWPVAIVLATITSIGIVVMAVKGVKKAFGIFFMGIRR